MTQREFDAAMGAFPRCAQRASGMHGGEQKRAILDVEIGKELAKFCNKVGRSTFLAKCRRPGPIGEHWHLVTRK